MSKQKPLRNTPLFEAAGRGFTCLFFGFGALASIVLANLHNFVGVHPRVAAIYAAALPKATVGAIGAGIATVALFVTAHEMKHSRNARTPAAKESTNPLGFMFSLGFVAFVWASSGLLGLAVKLSQVLAN